MYSQGTTNHTSVYIALFTCSVEGVDLFVFPNEDKAAKLAVQAVHDVLLNPDSFICYECCYIYSEDDDTYYFFIYAGGENKSGGTSDGEYMVFVKGGEVTDFADGKSADSLGLTGEGAAAQLTWTRYIGHDDWTHIDKTTTQSYAN